MGGRAAALLAEDDDQPKSRAAQLLAEPDEPAGAQYMADVDSKDAQLRKWLTPLAQKLGISDDPDDPENYYDYRKFFDAMQRGEVKSPDQPGGHWDSRFKDPNHPRAFLLDPTSGRYFNTETGTYTGGDKAEIPGEVMDRINGMDTPDLSREQWEAAKAGADRPAADVPKGARDVANYWESHYSDRAGHADEGSMLKGILGQLLGDVGNMASVGATPAKAGVGVLSKLKGAKGAMAATGLDVATQGAAGAVQGAGEALKDGEDMSGMLKRILESGGLSGVLELGANAIGGGAGKIGEGLEWAAKKAKNVVAGSNAREAGAILDKYGASADTNMLGELLDKYSPSGVFSPKSAAGHLEDAVAPQLQVQGQRVGQMIDKAGYDEGVNALVPGAHARFQSNVDDRALEAMRRPAGGEQRDFAAAMANKADEVHAMAPPQDLAEFVRDKSGFQSSGAAKGAVGYAETARAKADQAVGGEAKDMIAELMGQAEPGTFARWDDARQKTHELSMLQEVLAAKKAGESTAGDIGSTIGSAVVGAGLGGMAGAMTGDNAAEGAGLGAGAALAGAFGLTGGATRTAVRQLGGTGLADLGANVARSGGHLARGIGDAMQWLPTGAIGGAASDAAADESRGHQAYEVVEQALKANPRILGSYGAQLTQAEDFKGEVSRLLDDDPNFARLVRNLQAAWK